jgi:hypothetical protein
MLRHLTAFELAYWLRSVTLWVFLLVITALIMGASSSDDVVIGAALSNTLRNAPYVVQNFYAMAGLLTLLMATAFVNSAATRDFALNTDQILFATPLRRRDYVLGRFTGAALVSLVPMLGVSLGVLLARHVPWADADRFGPVHWEAHLKGLLLFAVPNTFLVAAILFAVAVLARSEVLSFGAGLGLFTAYNVADALVQDKLEYERLAALLDPFGIRTFAYVTKYWTVAERNSEAVGLAGMLLWNRALWVGVGVLALVLAVRRFRFAARSRAARRAPEDGEAPPSLVAPATPPVRRAAPLAKFLASTRLHFLGVLKSTAFLVVLGATAVNGVGSLLGSSESFGSKTFPVTYWVLQVLDGSFFGFVVILIVFYAGVVVWRDRDARFDEIADALPVPDWMPGLSRFTAMLAVALTVQGLALLCGLLVQTWQGYHRYQLDLYLSHLFVREGSLLAFLIVLALTVQALAFNKNLGHLLVISFLLANQFAWRPLNVATNLVRFAGRPRVTHSDFFGDAPFRLAWGWFTLYWLLACGLLAVVAVAAWPRGRERRWRERLGIARLRFRGGLRAAAACCALLAVGAGAWIAYNTKVRNRLLGPKDLDRLQADYEKAYKPFAERAFPRLRGVKYWIDLHPETRNMAMRGEAIIENTSGAPQEEIHFTLVRDLATRIDVPGASVVRDDERLGYRIFRFTPPLAPGETRTVRFQVDSRTRGFENSVTRLELVQNGTFFNSDFAPRIGYLAERELTDPNDRRANRLGEQQLMPALERDCTARCRDTYLGGSADWVDVETVISTSPDQIAIAPGSLRREWREGGRRFFEYRLDHASLAFYAFISARYEVAREDWNGLKLEVYHLKEHPWNVPRMMNAMRKSLDYLSRSFGPYAHRQARIIEFPRVARFAQAFPGTMPYSESIGFIANLEHPDDIDMVFYVVAHEIAHQWWAHQVVGANMQGGTLLSESLSQYSALMVMEHEFGRDAMRKFLRHEMDAYLRARGRERLKERPLLRVEAEQGYIHYRKASVVLYHLKEMIGEEAVNRALRGLVERYGYSGPPYPTSWALLDALRQETPADLQPLLKDLFEDITLFSNRTLEATARKRADGRFDVAIEVEARKFKADDKGAETEAPLDDWVEIGAFAKPEQGRKYGKTLYRQRVRLREARSRHTFVVDEAPEQAGIDPFLLLVDRVPEDNLKSIAASASPGDRAPEGLTTRPVS